MEIAPGSQTTVNINKWRLSLTLYLNYLIHGFGIIILAQNMTALGNSWNVPLKTVSFVISGIGVGRLIAYLITGSLADLLSRKLFVVIGMLCYLVFAVGMVMNPSIPVAYGLAILAGIANSALDAGTYTTLVEINHGKGDGTILLKGFMSLGEFILPILVATLANHEWWFGWSFIVMAAIIVLNFINVLTVRFPNHAELKQLNQAVSQTSHGPRGFKKVVATILLLGYGYTSMALMIWFTQWITLFAQQQLHFGETAAHFILSLYSIGSITGVIILFILLNRAVSELKLLIALNLTAVVALAILLFAGRIVWLANLASLIFGFAAAGGAMQTGLTVFMKLFPSHHGMITGAFYFFGSIASFTVPLITGLLSAQSIALAFSGDLIVGLVGTVIVIVLAGLHRTK
ncbi:MFS transporter [Lactobacillus alvi]|uniref:MFS transporter n=1 Tax=Limosilactobacillus alvi TaxID=990412 RepID=A0ABS2EMD6_9LACO|nr:MFS transporter [Limosilactobacillus alvi]MBM6753659.1 MFS transporter [Limosilactobacillus alvi]